MCIGLHKRQRISKGQSQETGNIGYARRRQTNQKHNTICVGHHCMQTNILLFRNTIYFLQNNIFYEDDAFYINVREHRMGNKKMDNPEKLATFGYTRRRQTKQTKQHNTIRKQIQIT